ncbi:glycosyltransferase [Nocardiopsis baichengensis]|uniref:glycosyltransferase n=1 Tax=Nocardiopsis baichengensis TaxID=280240 RepID=UPI0003795182|nr:glycosyltransferase [Nocardiopsis baichengensis]
MHTLRAASYAATLAWRHLREEPARAPLLALRVLPSPLRRAVRGAAARGGPLGRAYARADAGDAAGAARTARRACAGAPPRTAARMAAFALAVRDTALADELAAALPPGRRRASLERRSALLSGRAVAAGPSASGPSGPSEPVRPPSLTVARGRRTVRDGAVNGGRSAQIGGRVLHLVTNALPHTNAGYTQRTHRIAVAQRGAGWEPHVATRVGHPVSAGVPDARPRVLVDGVAYHRLVPWRAPAGAGAELRAGVRLAGALADRLDPQVLHAASNHRNGRLALELGRARGLPVVYEVRGFLEESWLSRDPSRSPADAFYQAERAQETACMLGADLVVTLGAAMRADIAARGVPEERILVVPNAVDEAFLEPLPDGGPVRRGLGIAPDAFVAGTTTSCYGYEGLDTLLEAVAVLRGRGTDAHALIVGDGPELPALRRRAAEAGLEGAAHFTGRVGADRVRAHHAALDVFAVPRRDERVCRLVTPLKPVEAMAGGLPVVASDLPALRELVEPGGAGALVPPDDAGALADLLGALAGDAGERARLGARARAAVGRDRTWAAAAERYSTAYRSFTDLRPV